jgi:dTDP-4-dehydrorhamnose reductase
LLVHYSTDYVFDGSGHQPWSETDTAKPLSVYGQSKFEGEPAILASGCRHLIFRTSWVHAARGVNFAKTMLRLAQEREYLTVIDDQIGGPTGANLLVDVSAHAVRAAMHRPQLLGLYHLAATGRISWHGYACFVIERAREAGLDTQVALDAIERMASSAFATAAARSKNSRRNTNKLQAAFDLRLPDWQSGVARMLTEIIEQCSKT